MSPGAIAFRIAGVSNGVQPRARASSRAAGDVSTNAALRQTFTTADSLQDIQDAGLSATQAQQVFNAVRAPDTAQTDGVIYKGTLQVTPTPDTLFYATYSEGFRPGLLNRPGGATNGAGFGYSGFWLSYWQNSC